MTINCPSCQSHLCQTYQVKQPVFRHLDFHAVGKEKTFSVCKNCSLIFNQDPILKDDEFKSDAYAESKQTRHTMVVQGQSISRSGLQAKLYADLVPPKGKVLDVGCFDGEFLRSLAALRSDLEFHGFDVNSNLKKYFPQGKNFYFHHGDGLDVVPSLRFDFILLSHSLIYVPGLSHFWKKLKALMHSETKLIIHVPDLAANSTSLLLHDQFYHFTLPSLLKVLSCHGFRSQELASHPFSREIVVSATLGEAQQDLDMDKHLSDIQDVIASFSQREKVLKNLPGDKYAILGTTLVASWMDELLGEKNVCFVDENQENLKKDFKGKKVIHPKELGTKYELILGYGAANKSIDERFQKEHGVRSLYV